MTRFERKNRTDIIYKTGGFLDLIDNAVKEKWRINDEEYDYLLGNMTDDELSFLLLDKIVTWSQVKFIIKKINNLLEKK